MVSQTELHPGFNGNTRTTSFSYLGFTSQQTGEVQTNSTGTLAVKDYSYDPAGRRLSMTDTPFSGGTPQTPTTYTYGYDVHGSTSQLLDPSGNTKASYGYRPYGQADADLSKGDTDTVNLFNPFRYTAKRYGTGSQTYDMGARRFGPDTNRFLNPDLFHGALANLGLATDPLTNNRYALAAGNPISYKEWDGHMVLLDGGGGTGTTSGDTSQCYEAQGCTTSTSSVNAAENRQRQTAGFQPACGWSFTCIDLGLGKSPSWVRGLPTTPNALSQQPSPAVLERLQEEVKKHGASYATFEQTTLTEPYALTLSFYLPISTGQAVLGSWRPGGEDMVAQLTTCPGCPLQSSRSKRQSNAVAPTPSRQLRANAVVQGYTLTRTGKLYYFVGAVTNASKSSSSFKVGAIHHPDPTPETVSSFPAGESVSWNYLLGRGQGVTFNMPSFGLANEVSVSSDQTVGGSLSVTYGREI